MSEYLAHVCMNGDISIVLANLGTIVTVRMEFNNALVFCQFARTTTSYANFAPALIAIFKVRFGGRL